MQAIVAHTESVELNDQLCAHREDSVETALRYTDGDSTCTVINDELVVEVPLYVIAGDIALDFCGLFHLLIAIAGVDGTLVCFFQLGNGHHVGCVDAAVADAHLVSGLHWLVEVTLTGCQRQRKAADEKGQQI